MLLVAFFVLFGACVVASNPVKSSNEYSIQESRADVEWQDDFLMREDRGRRGKCKKGEIKIKYIAPKVPEIPGTSEAPEAPDYSRCRKCTCIRRKFRRCRDFVCELGQLQCDKKDYEFHPGQCCPECKRKNCSEHRKVGEEWQRLKKTGVCSLCKCIEGRKEFCEDSALTCYPIPGCLETEMKPDLCCPVCKTKEKPTTQPWITIKLTTEGSEPPFTFPWRDTAEDQVEN